MSFAYLKDFLPPRLKTPRGDRTLARTNPLLAAWLKYQEPFLLDFRSDFENFEHKMQHGRRAFILRRRVAPRWSWAVPTDEALDLIVQHGPIVEIGAGTGYWARLLRARGCVVRAYDIDPPHRRRNSYGHRRVFVPVLRGGPRKAKQFSDHTLFLCWPPLRSDMAVNALRMYRGRTLIYVGEWDGCNATTAFFDELDHAWTQIASVDIPQWDGIHDSLSVWQRK